MTEKERHAKITEGVTQIGRLVGTCAKHEMTVADIMTMLQTATSLVCEMNEIDIAHYMKFLYVLHKRRLDGDYDGSDEQIVMAEISNLFNLKEPH